MANGGKHAEALVAAATYAAAQAAHEAISTELAATNRRLHAIEHRWIPEHEAVLQTLELELAQRELEDTIRVRWILKRHGGS